MQIFLILAVLIAILAVIFAVQNVTVVSVSLFVWHVNVSLAIALLVALAAGVLITLLLSIPGKIKDSWNSVSKKKKFSSLAAERDNLQMKVEEAAAERDRILKKLEASQQEVADLEEQLANLSAALQEADKSPRLPGPPMAPAPGTESSLEQPDKTEEEQPEE